MDAVFNRILSNERYPDPGRVVVSKIMEANFMQYWSYKCSRFLLIKRERLLIIEAHEKQMVSALNEIVIPVIEQRNRNKLFYLFSDRLYTTIYKRLQEMQDTSD